MIENTLMRRRVAAGVAVAAGAIGLMVAMPASATTDEPEEFEGNPTCGDLAPEGVEWTEFKYEPVVTGTDGDGTLEVTITVNETEDGPTFDWTSNIGVDAVFVKGGPGGNLYSYDESVGDDGLHAPVNPANDKYYGLSHISFCYDEDGTTPTTPPSTPPTTPTDVTITPNTTVPGPDTTTPTGSTPGAPAAPAAQPVTGQPTYAG
jgi:hypothetical protein